MGSAEADPWAARSQKCLEIIIVSSFLSWLLASFSFPFLPSWIPLSYINLAGQEFVSGLCGFAFFLFEFESSLSS